MNLDRALSLLTAGRPIGFIGWYGPWRKYTFQPEPNTVFEQDCLRDIAAFCEQQTWAHRARGLR